MDTKQYKLTTEVVVDLNSIINTLLEWLSYEELLEFILELDKQVADWDFTNDLYMKLHEIMQDYSNYNVPE